MSVKLDRIIITGGGIGGLSAAIGLQQKGYDVMVYEQAKSLKEVGAGIIIWPNAVHALKLLGSHDTVINHGYKITHSAIRTSEGRILIFNKHNSFEELTGEPTIAIHRASLQHILLDLLKPDTIITNKRCTSFNQTPDNVRVIFEDGGSEICDLLIAADGINSIVRQQLFPEIKPRYAGYTAWRGIVRNNDSIDFGISTESWGNGTRFGIVGIHDHKIYWFATANTSPGVTMTSTESKNYLLHRFRDWHNPVPQLIATTHPKAILKNDIFDIRPFRHWGKERVILLGDAAHPTTPNMGQGACMAIESATVLSHLLASENNLNNALVKFERQRYPRTSFVTRQSRRIGRMAQWEDPHACRLRNAVLRIAPSSLFEHQLKKLFRFNNLDW